MSNWQVALEQSNTAGSDDTDRVNDIASASVNNRTPTAPFHNAKTWRKFVFTGRPGHGLRAARENALAATIQTELPAILFYATRKGLTDVLFNPLGLTDVTRLHAEMNAITLIETGDNAPLLYNGGK